MNEPERRVPDLSQPVNPTTGEIDRFLAKVDKRSSPHGCWIWTASKNEHGYGKFGFRTGIIKAPRMSWAVFVGVIPSGIHVLHNCPGGDNPSCVNPDHLWLGTIADNAADKVSKGRQARGDTHKSRTRPDTIKRGSNHPMSKFTEADVVSIRARLAKGELVTRIAAEYGVWHGAVSHIKNGKRWTHLAG